MKTYGPSNDEPLHVQIEIAAAEKIAEIAEVLGGETNVWGDDMTTTFSGGLWHDELNESLWPWDPSRPVAGQYDDWLITQRPTQELASWPDADLDDAIRAIHPLTEAELDQPECPTETAEAIERIAKAVEGKS